MQKTEDKKDRESIAGRAAAVVVLLAGVLLGAELCTASPSGDNSVPAS